MVCRIQCHMFLQEARLLNSAPGCNTLETTLETYVEKLIRLPSEIAWNVWPRCKTTRAFTSWDPEFQRCFALVWYKWPANIRSSAPRGHQGRYRPCRFHPARWNIGLECCFVTKSKHPKGSTLWEPKLACPGPQTPGSCCLLCHLPAAARASTGLPHQVTPKGAVLSTHSK